MNLQSWRRVPIPKGLIFWGEYIIFRWLSFVLTALPYEMATGLVRSFVRFAYSIAGRYKKITIENIMLAQPPVVKSPNEADELALKTFEHFALTFVHMLYMDRFIHLKDKKHIRFENSGVIDNALKQNPKGPSACAGEPHADRRPANRGVLLISGHLGNWEVGINELAKRGYSINLVAFQYVNPYLNNMMNQFRLRCGVKIIPTKGAISKCEEALKRGEAVIMLVDQTGRDAGVDAEFFGRTAPAMWGPANLHLKTGAPIIPYGVRYDSGPDAECKIHYTISVKEPIRFQPTGNKDSDIKQLAQLYLSEIEKIIRQAPEQWIWFHRRWKKYK